jgi:hypothetical protein
MQTGKRGDVDGVEDGALLGAKDLRSLGRKALPPSTGTNPKMCPQHGPSFFLHTTPLFLVKEALNILGDTML